MLSLEVASRNHDRALAVSLLRQDLVCITANRLDCFHKNEFDKMTYEWISLRIHIVSRNTQSYLEHAGTLQKKQQFWTLCQLSDVLTQKYHTHTNTCGHRGQYLQSRVETGTSNLGSIGKGSYGFRASSQQSPNMTMTPV